MSQTQRAHLRVKAVIPVMIRNTNGDAIHGEVHDISLGGASVRCPQPFTVGDSVTIELRFAGLKSSFGWAVDIEEIDDSGMVRAEEIAEVRWLSGDTFGLKFKKPSAKTRRFLERLVKFFEQLKDDELSIE